MAGSSPYKNHCKISLIGEKYINFIVEIKTTFNN